MARGFSMRMTFLAIIIFAVVGVTSFVALGHWRAEPPPKSTPVAPTTAVPAAPPASPEKIKKPEGEPEFTKVTIDSKTFKLEVALDYDHRLKGLSDRTEIPADGGMLFVFPQADRQYFVMRDCPIPIDIIFLDASGRITAFHKMKVEDPRKPDEGKPGDVNQIYENRLKRYSSKYDAQYVIELKGDTLDGLKIKEGQQIKLDADLKARCK